MHQMNFAPIFINFFGNTWNTQKRQKSSYFKIWNYLAIIHSVLSISSKMQLLPKTSSSEVKAVCLKITICNFWTSLCLKVREWCTCCLYSYTLIGWLITISSIGQTKQQSLRNFGSTLENCLVPVTRPDNFCNIKRIKDVDAPTSFVRYRTISGICNNLTPGKAAVGAAGTITARFFERKLTAL